MRSFTAEGSIDPEHARSRCRHIALRSSKMMNNSFYQDLTGKPRLFINTVFPKNCIVIINTLRQISQSELPGLLCVLSGRASAGFPSQAADLYEPPILVEPREPHVWRTEAEGDSMSPAGILTECHK
ncbi:hypothetical protein J3A69_002100 [Pseudomonas putida]|nr:hypothetical protein [Pseudomonas sp. PvP089]MBP2091344.1 hypothetical protein [Pseudomonas sp. PvP088]MBP2222493.1 hypothetical protein [Pseudomonas putida]